MALQNPLDISISRRSLFGAAATLGALHFLGVFSHPGGIGVAYADDAGNTAFKVYALSREEIPLIAFNAKDNARTPIEGMTVTLTSLYNGATVTATTDKNGCAVANIRALDDASPANSEAFAARVRVDAVRNGYRTFVELDQLVISGQHANAQGVMHNILQVPTQPDDGSPYLSCACLDGRDVQYLAETVGLVSENDMTHTLAVQLENGGANTSWDFAFESSSASERLGSSTSVTTDSRGTASATMQGQWLDGAHGIVEGDELSITFGRSGSSTLSYVLRLNLTCEQQYLLVANMCSDNYEVAPGLGAQNTNDSQEEKEKNEDSWFSLPDWLTFKDQSSALSIPFTPIKIFGDTKGNIGISATLFEVPFYKYRDGKRVAIEPKDEFKTFGDFCTDWWDSYKDELENAFSRIFEADLKDEDGNLKTFGASKWTSKFDVKFTAEALAYGKCTKPQDPQYSLLAHFDIGAQLALALSYCLQRQLFVCGIPLIFGFDFSAALTGMFMFGARCNEYLQNLSWDFKISEDYECPSQILIKLHAEIGVSLGIGVIGVASVSVRGYGFFETTVDTNTDTEEEYEKIICPHVKLQLGGHFQVIVQLLLFTKTVQLDSFDPLTIYDNWKKKELGDGQPLFNGGAMPLPDNRYGAPSASLVAGGVVNGDGMTMVSEASLANTVELRSLLNTADGTPVAFQMVQGKHTLSHSLAKAGIRDPYAKAPSEVSGLYGSAGLTTTSAALDSALGNISAANGYNPLRGIRPSTQEKLWSGVFSAPHVQVVVVGGKRYLLRLSTVEISVAANDENLYVVSDKDGCLFVKAKEGNRLPKVFFDSDDDCLKVKGGLLGDGVAVTYPLESGCSITNVTMANLIGFEDVSSYTEEQARTLAEKLCSTDDHGTPVNSVEDVAVVRTRLTISAFDDDTATWGDPVAIEFALPTTSTEYMRANSWDVDFQATGSDDGLLYVGLTSIVRPYDQAKLFDEQFDRQFVTLLQVHPETAAVSYAASSIGMLASNGDVYWYPRVAACSALSDDGTKCTYASVFYFFKDGIQRYISGRVITPVFNKDGLSFYADYHDMVSFPEMYTVLYFDEGTYDVHMAAPDGTIKTLTRFFSWSMLGKEGTLVDVGDCVSVAWAWSCWRHENISEGHVLKHVSKLSFGPITRVSDTQVSADWFYTVESGGANGGERLLRCLKCTATLPLDYVHEQASDVYEELCPVGTTSNVLTFEVSQDGTRLYAVRAMEGTMPALDGNNEAALNADCAYYGTYSPTNSPQAELPYYEDTPVEQYQLMCAFLNASTDSFYEFFPMADLDFAPDSIIEVPGTTNRYDFILSSITDITQNMLDVYQVAVPRVIGLQMEGAGSVSKYAMGGDACRYQVTVANTGNVPIGGFTVTLMGRQTDSNEGEFKLIDTQVLSSLGDLVQTDNTMVKPSYDADGIPTDTFAVAEDERDTSGILWPGKTRTYQSTFTMPANAEGALEVRVAVSDPIEYASSAGQISSLAATSVGDGLTAEHTLTGTTLSCVDTRARLFAADSSMSVTLQPNRVDATYEVKDSSSTDTTPKTGESGLLVAAALAAVAAATAAEEGIRRGRRAKQGEGMEAEIGAEDDFEQ